MDELCEIGDVADSIFEYFKNSHNHYLNNPDLSEQENKRRREVAKSIINIMYKETDDENHVEEISKAFEKDNDLVEEFRKMKQMTFEQYYNYITTYKNHKSIQDVRGEMFWKIKRLDNLEGRGRKDKDIIKLIARYFDEDVDTIKRSITRYNATLKKVTPCP